VKTGGGAGGGAAGGVRISVGGGDDTEVRIEGREMGRGDCQGRRTYWSRTPCLVIGGRNWYAIVIKLYR
jgi:hypothetical protein